MNSAGLRNSRQVRPSPSCAPPTQQSTHTTMCTMPCDASMSAHQGRQPSSAALLLYDPAGQSVVPESTPTTVPPTTDTVPEQVCRRGGGSRDGCEALRPLLQWLLYQSTSLACRLCSVSRHTCLAHARQIAGLACIGCGRPVSHGQAGASGRHQSEQVGAAGCSGGRGCHVSINGGGSGSRHGNNAACMHPSSVGIPSKVGGRCVEHGCNLSGGDVVPPYPHGAPVRLPWLGAGRVLERRDLNCGRRAGSAGG